MNKEYENHRYDDIINLPHPVSERHPQMPIADRAAQFSPFAALKGGNIWAKQKEDMESDSSLEKSL